MSELDDGPRLSAHAAGRFGAVSNLGVGARERGKAVIRLLNVFSNPELRTVSPLVNRMRRIKTPEELVLMERAAHIADSTMAAVTERIRPGGDRTRSGRRH